MDEGLIREVLAFREKRNWEQFHNPKDLAISLSLEASELLENFQWKTAEEALSLNRESILDELADVLIYAIYLAKALDANLEEVIRNKLTKNELKYPVDKAYGRKEKYTDLQRCGYDHLQQQRPRIPGKSGQQSSYGDA